jgi:hypothetical protein
MKEAHAHVVFLNCSKREISAAWYSETGKHGRGQDRRSLQCCQVLAGLHCQLLTKVIDFRLPNLTFCKATFEQK